MTELLSNTSRVLLFGRVLQDVTLNTSPPTQSPAPSGSEPHLHGQLKASGASLARIWAFSFNGEFFELPTSIIMLVHGEGEKAAETLDHTGTVRRPNHLSTDLKVWAYDKDDISMRLDVSTGTIESILLQAELAADQGMAAHGVKLSAAGVKLSAAGVKLANRARGGD